MSITNSNEQNQSGQFSFFFKESSAEYLMLILEECDLTIPFDVQLFFVVANFNGKDVQHFV